MRLTQHTDYALRTLIFLGVKGEAQSTIEEISKGHGISRNHLMKVVQRLVSEGYVESRRGVGGGIRLAKAPSEIVIGDVVRRLEPDLGLAECFRPGNACVLTPVCALSPLLDKALQAFLSELDQASLEDLITPAGHKSLALRMRIR